MKNIKQAADEAFIRFVNDLEEDRSRIWNSIEVHEHFGDDLLILSGIGVASILSFRSKAYNVLNLVANDDYDDDAAISKMATRIVTEIIKLRHDKFKYRTRVSIENSFDDVTTLLNLM